MLPFPVSWLLIGALSGKVSEGIVDPMCALFFPKESK